jgi:hypothetical protein
MFDKTSGYYVKPPDLTLTHMNKFKDLEITAFSDL